MTNAEAVIVGSELLLGAVDTNGPDIARRLAPLGAPLRLTTVVGDADADLQAALSRAVERSSVVIVSGGLGPTEDDRTRFAISRLSDRPLEPRPDLLEDIRAAFARFGVEMSDSNRVQALLPAGAEGIRNPLGTAPGFALEVGGAFLVALPGVPRELRHLLDHWVVPRLRELLGAGAVASRTLRLSGLGESRVGEAVADLMTPEGNPYLGILASPGEVRLVITARGQDEAEARALLEGPEREIRARLGKHLFGTDDETHARVALRDAARAGWGVASTEGFTGGRLAARLWEAGEPTYRGSQVLPATSLRSSGAPEATILALARRAAEAAGAEAGLAVALESELGPPPAEDRIWIGTTAPGHTRARPFPLIFGADTDRERACNQALYELRRLAARA